MAKFDTPTELNNGCCHPRTTHYHGTYACYVLDKCRCHPCSSAATAQRAYQDRRRNYVLYGRDEYRVYVSADRARARIIDLQEAGWGYKRIAAEAGVAAGVVAAILWGIPARGRGPRQKITPDTEAKLLSVELPTPDQLHLRSAIPSFNWIRALHHLGYSIDHLARLTHDGNPQALRRILGGARSTSANTHTAVERVFTALWNTPYEPAGGHERAAATRARNRAQAGNWPRPLELDDTGHLEPVDQTEPIIDMVAIHRALDGDDTPQLTSAEIDEMIRHGYARRLTSSQIADRLGLTSDAITARIRRKELLSTDLASA